MNHLRQQFPVWGTIVDVDCYSQFVSDADLNETMKKITDFCELVDENFSTYKDESWVTRLRRGKVAIENCTSFFTSLINNTHVLCAIYICGPRTKRNDGLIANVS
jgi:hypothetical protein